MKRLIVLMLSVVFVFCLFGCGGGSDENSVISGLEEDPPAGLDTTAPAKISLNSLSVNDTETTFTWTDPSDADFDHLEVTYSGSTEIVVAGTETWTITGLTEEWLYKISVKSVDESGNESDAVVFYVETLASGSSDSDFILIEDAVDLVAVSSDLDENYLVIADIYLSSSWTPIGDGSTQFTGIFNGNGHTVSNLSIITTNSYQGLFGYTDGCVISGLGIIGASVSGGESIGGLVGYNLYSTISDCYATGTVSGTGYYTGGLVGYNLCSTISDCYATGIVSGNNIVGGLVGYNYDYSAISDSYATGSVSSTAQYAGGLVGVNCEGSTISDCYATGTVSGVYNVGGLVGDNNGNSTISYCYATGAVSGTGDVVSGLVAFNTRSSTISCCYAIGAATGTDRVGGLVGWNDNGTISDSYAAGTATGTDEVGGLVGYNETTSTISDCYATGAVSGTGYVGGLVGYDDGSGTISDSFYDSVTTGYDDATWTLVGTAKTTEEMQSVDTFTLIGSGLGTAWDFVLDPNDDVGLSDTWDIDASINGGYPHLNWLLDSY